MSSIFTKIVNGEIPCFKIAETTNCFAFLDIRPLTKGHALVIPKKEVDYLFDLDQEDYADLQNFSRSVALALKKTINCKRIAVVVLGMEVPHAHIHLIPINQESDIQFTNPRVKMSNDELSELANTIGKHL